METQVCTKCEQELPIEDFSWKDREHRWRNRRCKACICAYVAANYQENEEYRNKRLAAARAQNSKTEDQSRKHSLKHNYNLTVGQYNQVLQDQLGCCALCGVDNPGRDDPNKKWKAKHWNIDHDHLTGFVRGLLCHTCNVRVGAYERLMEDVGIERLTAYLSNGIQKRYDLMDTGDLNQDLRKSRRSIPSSEELAECI